MMTREQQRIQVADAILKHWVLAFDVKAEDYETLAIDAAYTAQQHYCPLDITKPPEPEPKVVEP